MPWFKASCLLLAAGIALGAFGAHGLKETLTPYLLSVYEKAVFYHLTQAVGLLVLVLLPDAGAGMNVARWLLLAGVIIFSGSLYLLAVLDQRWLGMITPIGGTCLIVAWIVAAFSYTKA
jgi:uncharacterized membrane protein YgdD (TMEM256/DUF423 family)